MKMRIRVNQILPLFCLALLIVFPLIAPALNLTFYVSFIRRVMIFALAATSLNFILGYGGMVALGHAAFFGAGAYVVAILSAEGVVSALIAWPAAIVIAGLLALVVGAISLRTRGVYFIMITLAFAQMVYYIFISLRKYGGEDGINLSGHSKLPDWLSGLSLADDVTFYYVVLLIVVLSLIILNRLVASHFGQALQGIRENESRMLALGYPVMPIKLLAFVIAGGFAGLAGALFANHNLFVSPSMMHWTASASLIVMVIIGGIGLRYGGVVGAAVMLTFEEFLRLYTEYWHLPFGLLLLAIVLLAPRGLAGALSAQAHGSGAQR
ncbi:branched-chain amino acid ABC transporter permease [Orrella sp. NBD-18]|uniref:Branched-chain amino acid ABC transporter permease n=1 Tax=Sheuella amnicola TaxID=2707330 RepID=A0A6B2R3F0_9BURK|nr:branched-chain amino acid ABC transporter permease [Sheuella amnicola]